MKTITFTAKSAIFALETACKKASNAPAGRERAEIIATLETLKENVNAEIRKASTEQWTEEYKADPVKAIQEYLHGMNGGKIYNYTYKYIEKYDVYTVDTRPVEIPLHELLQLSSTGHYALANALHINLYSRIASENNAVSKKMFVSPVNNMEDATNMENKYSRTDCRMFIYGNNSNAAICRQVKALISDMIPEGMEEIEVPATFARYLLGAVANNRKGRISVKDVNFICNELEHIARLAYNGLSPEINTNNKTGYTALKQTKQERDAYNHANPMGEIVEDKPNEQTAPEQEQKTPEQEQKTA